MNTSGLTIESVGGYCPCQCESAKHHITLPAEIDTVLDLIPAWKETRDGQ